MNKQNVTAMYFYLEINNFLHSNAYINNKNKHTPWVFGRSTLNVKWQQNQMRTRILSMQYSVIV